MQFIGYESFGDIDIFAREFDLSAWDRADTICFLSFDIIFFFWLENIFFLLLTKFKKPWNNMQIGHTSGTFNKKLSNKNLNENFSYWIVENRV